MAYAIPHPHSGAVRFPSQQLDFNRILGQAGAIAVNAAMLLLLLTPMNVPIALAPPEPEPQPVWIREKRPPVVPPPVNIVSARPTPTRPTATPQSRPLPIPAPVDPIVAPQPGDVAVEPPPLEAAGPVAGPVDPGLPLAGAALEALTSPSPSYPAQAVREGLSGTVLLEILVGVDGRPLEVSIVRSSGHRILDQAARRVVLSRWTFRPAMRDGQPVQALGRVPIDFVLER